MNFRLHITIIGILIISINSYSQIKVSSNSIYEYEYVLKNEIIWEEDEDCILTDTVFAEVR